MIFHFTEVWLFIHCTRFSNHYNLFSAQQFQYFLVMKVIFFFRLKNWIIKLHFHRIATYLHLIFVFRTLKFSHILGNSDAVRDLVSFVQFEKRENHPRSVTSSKVTGWTPPWVFFTFSKLYNWYQIAQGIMFYRWKLKSKLRFLN